MVNGHNVSSSSNADSSLDGEDQLCISNVAAVILMVETGEHLYSYQWAHVSMFLMHLGLQLKAVSGYFLGP